MTCSPAPWGRGQKRDDDWERWETGAEVGRGWGEDVVLFKVVVYDSYTNLYKDIKILFIKKLPLPILCSLCL